MTSNNLASSRDTERLSIQSCFPEIKSLTNSMSESTTGCSDDLVMLQRQLIRPFLTFSNIQNPHLQLPQVISSSIDFPEVERRDAQTVLNPSMWPLYDVGNKLARTSTELTTKAAADSASSLQAAVAHSSAEFAINKKISQWQRSKPSTGPTGRHYQTLEEISQIENGGMTRNFFTTYVPLHLAALKGDWDAAVEFLSSNPQALRARITRNLETALHIAAGAKHTLFVQKLVEWMTPDDLAIQNKVGNTALCFAAASGITKIAEVMVNKNKKLPSIRGSQGATPLCMAALLGHKDMVWYLYSVTNEEDLTEKDFIELLVAAITADLYDVALAVIQHHPELALARDGNGETALHVLARKPSAFSSGNGLRICPRCIYSCVRKTCEAKLMHIHALELVDRLWKQVLLLDDLKIGDLLRTPSRLLFTAAELGNVEFLTVLIRLYPNLIWKVDDHSRSIFHIAVVHRQEKIFNLIHEMGAHKDLIAAYKDENKNNMLHLAGKLAPPNRLKIDSGAALQLRRELHWFKEVEKVVQPSYREMNNSEGRTPHILFSEEHEGLVREGEKWMKDTASSCMVVAALIATVNFAAAFTVPGGNKNDTGRPIFLHEMPFMVFAISNALALFSSATSILILLSILTSRYAEEDFLHSLPNRLVIGLTTLFISIATMMIAFSASLFIVLGHEFAWIAIPIDITACVPVTLFALLQFPLFADMINHIYSFNIFSRPSNHLLY